MSIHEQIETIKKNISNNHDPAILFAMNQKYRELEEKAEKISKIISIKNNQDY